MPFEAMLFHDVNTDNGVTGGRRVDGENFAFEAAKIVNPGRDDELLVDTLAAAEKNHKVVFLRIFALAFGPGNDVVGVVEYEIVIAFDQIAQERRRIGDRIDLDPNVFL